ncbi:hypothetical protein A9Q84_09330 [Halobacteriovorax marinus]|uniref:histidine kinase n=1 Tax=Halobacteriovorax marinus TaxID=97084 RepID=A0A1Y5FCG8_9BACT|nr:hypothetical protein A9Q84_09330 [Halobacteriovorax marinus]
MKKKDYRLSAIIGFNILITILVVATPIIYIQYQTSSQLFEEKLIQDFEEDLKLTQLFLNSEFKIMNNSLNSISENKEIIKSLEEDNFKKVKKVLEEISTDFSSSDFLFISFDQSKETIDVSINLHDDSSIIEEYLERKSNETLSFGVYNNSNVVIFTKKPIISTNSGKVLATIHTGILLNNNLELLSKISDRINHHNLFVFLGDKFIAGIRPLKEEERKIFQSSFSQKLFSTDQKIYYSGKLDIFEDVDLNIYFETSSLLIEELRQSYFKYVIYTVVLTFILAFISMLLTHALLTPNLKRLLNFLHSTIEDDNLSTYKKSSIEEFNIISDDFSTVFQNFKIKKNQLSRFINSSQLPILIWDNDGTIIQLNESAKNFLDLEKVGENIVQDSLLNESYSFKQLLNKLEVNNEIFNEEIIFKNKKEWKYSLWTINKDKHEEIYFAQCFDNSEKVKAQVEIELERAKSIHNQKLAALGEVASSIAHEVNNPMGVISLSLSILEDEFHFLKITNAKKSEKIERCLNNIDDSVTRTSSIISNLLDFSRESSKDKQDNKKLKILIDKTLIFIESKIKKQKVRILIEDMDSELNVFIKETQFSQVLINLLNNSIDALENCSVKKITITNRSENGYCYLGILDSGTGIPSSMVEKIFTPFFTTKEKGKGTGLGLSISKSIMKEMKGDLILKESEQGAHFIIKLPLKN